MRNATPWKSKHFSEFATLRRGLTYTPNDCRSDGVRVLRSSNISEDSFVIGSDDVFVLREAANIPHVRNGDILITAANGSSHLVGKHAVINGIGEGQAVHGGFMLLASTGEPDFLHASMSSSWYRDFVTNHMLGGNGALGNLGIASFDEAIFFAPCEKKERDEIGTFFYSLDALIEARAKALEKVESLKKSMLLKMFPQGESLVPEVRFKGFDGEWERRKLGETVVRVTRKNTKLESELPLTISAEYGLIDQHEFFNNRVAARDVSGYYLVKMGEFAYNKSTSDGSPWGVVKRLTRYPMGVLSTLYIVFALKDEETDPEYFERFFETRLWHADVSMRAAEGARNHGLLNITPDDFFETRILLPALAEQQKIGSYFRSLDALIAARRDEIGKLKQMKKALLERMFV
jgi:type I restriction enzyme S subunit